MRHLIGTMGQRKKFTRRLSHCPGTPRVVSHCPTVPLSKTAWDRRVDGGTHRDKTDQTA